MGFLKKLLEFMLGCLGPGSVLFHIHLFDTYFDLGKPSPDGLHTVALNNHGALSYITESQSQTLDFSLGVALLMLLVFFAVVIARVRRDRESA